MSFSAAFSAAGGRDGGTVVPFNWSLWDASEICDAAGMDAILCDKQNVTDVNQRHPTFGITSFFLACMYGIPSCVRVLLRHGANVNLIANDGVGPLSAAARAGKSGVVSFLACTVPSVSLDARDGAGRTAADFARQKDDCLAELLQLAAAHREKLQAWRSGRSFVGVAPARETPVFSDAMDFEAFRARLKWLRLLAPAVNLRTEVLRSLVLRLRRGGAGRTGAARACIGGALVSPVPPAAVERQAAGGGDGVAAAQVQGQVQVPLTAAISAAELSAPQRPPRMASFTPASTATTPPPRSSSPPASSATETAAIAPATLPPAPVPLQPPAKRLSTFLLLPAVSGLAPDVPLRLLLMWEGCFVQDVLRFL